MVTATMTKLAQDYSKAFNSHDLEKLISFFASDCTVENVGTGMIYRGVQEVKNYYRDFFKAFPDVKMEFKTNFTSGEWWATEWEMTGTNSGNMPSSGNFPELKATNKKFNIKGATISQWRNDKTIRSTYYWNAAGLMMQLGIMSGMAAK